MIQSPHDLFFPFNFCNEFLFAGEVELVPRREELAAVIEYRVPHNRLVFFRAENDAYRRIIFTGFYPVLKQPHVHIHLSDILMCQPSRLEIDEYETFQDIVIEDKIDIKLRCFSTDPELAANKRESFSQFQEELPELVD